MNIQEIRKRVPALAGLDDQTLMDTVHQQYFADTPVNDFYKKFNYQPKSQAGEGAGALRTAGDIGIKLAQGVVDLGSSAVGIGSLLTGGLLGKGMRAIGYDPQATNDALGEYLSDAQKAADKKVAEADGFFDTIGQSIANPRSIVGGIAQSMPGMLGAMGITRAVAGKLATSAALATAEGQAASKAVIAAGGSGENAIAAALSTTAGKEAAEKALEASATRLLATGAATEGAQTAGQIADDAQAKGRDYADYAMPAVAAGVGTAAIGLGAGKLMGDAATSIATGSKAAGVKGNWAQQIGKEFLSEGVLEEMPQSAQEQFFTNMAQGNANLMDGVANAAGSGLVVGGVQGAAMGGIQDLARHRTKLLKDTGPLSRASNAVTESRQEPSVPMLPYNPDALITFKDGTTARQSQLNAMLDKLPTEQEKMELRAKILGYEPEAAEPSMQRDPLVAFQDGLVVPQDKAESEREKRDQAQKVSDENRIKQAESNPRSWSLEDAQAMNEAAKEQGRDLYVVPHLDNGYTLLPKKWLSPQDIHEYAPLQIRTAQPESNAEQQNAPEQPSEALGVTEQAMGVSAEAPAVSGQALGVTEQAPVAAQEQTNDDEGNLDNSVDESLLKDLVADTDARVAGGDQQRVEAHRAAVLDGVLSSDSAPGRSVASLAREFSKKLAESGVKQTMTTDAELQRLRRFADVSAVALSEPVQQDNLSGLVKERQQSPEANSNKKAQFDAVDRAIAQGMRLKVPSGSVLTKKGSSKIFRLNDAQKAHYAKQIATIEGQQAGATPDVVSAAPAEVEAPAQSSPPAPVQQTVVQKEIPAGSTDNVQSPDKTQAPAPVQTPVPVTTAPTSAAAPAQVAQQTMPEQQGQKAPASDLRPLAIEAMEQQLRQLKAGMARNKSKARSAGSLDEKLHLLEQAEQKEKALRLARQQIFNAENAFDRVVETGDKSHFNDYRAIFPGTAAVIDQHYAGGPTVTPATAPEHRANVGKPLDTGRIYDPAANRSDVIRQDPVDESIVPLTMSAKDFKEVTDEWAQLFADPEKRVLISHKADEQGYLTKEEAQKVIDGWKAHVREQYQDHRIENSNKTILSLFDLSGEWSKPWEEAGYNVIRFDIQNGQDVNDFSVEYFTDNYDLSDVYGILAACPCTDFASSGARHFAAKDADGRTEASKELVFQTLKTIEYFRPKFWALENPVGRIEKLTGLPKARMTFDPHHFGEDYTKKTVLWGNFEADLPTANVEPTEGSKMHRLYGGKSQATKNARSVTPEGFSYAFFMANNYVDLPPEKRLTGDYPEASGAIKQALNAGISEQEIRTLIDDQYGDYEYEDARNTLIKAVAERLNGKAPESSALTSNRQSEQYQSYIRHIDRFNDEGRRLSATEQELILSDNRITEDEYHDLQKRIDDNRRVSALHTEAHESAASHLNDLPEPTPAQAEAGNYKKGHIRLHGLDITVENPQGSTRSGTDETGKRWESTMQHHYGYIKGTVGADGDHIDVFVGSKPSSEKVFIVDQVNPRTGAFDEHKVMLGFDSMDEARAGYLANYEAGWSGGRDMVETNLSTFKGWLENGNHKKPFYTAKKAPAPRNVTNEEKPAQEPEKPQNAEKTELAKLRDQAFKDGENEAAKISRWTEKVSGKAKVKRAVLESLFKNAANPEIVTGDLASQILKELESAANKEKPEQKKAGKQEAGTLTLRDDFGTDAINGYEDTAEFPADPESESGTHGVKAAFIKDAKAYLSDVAVQLDQYGFSNYRDKKGKAQKPVSVNEGGIAVSGDISLAMFNETLGHGVYVNISEGASIPLIPQTKQGVTVMARVTDPGQPYGGGRNLWLPVDLQSAELAKRLHDEVSRVAERMRPKEDAQAPVKADPAPAKTEQASLFNEAVEKQEDDAALLPYRDQAAIAGLSEPLMRQLEQTYHSNDADEFVSELNKELAKSLNKLTVNNMTDQQLMLADQLIAGGNALLQKRADSIEKQMRKRGIDTGATSQEAFKDQPAEQSQQQSDRALSDVIVATSDYQDGNLIRLTLPADQAFRQVDSRVDTLKQLIKCMVS